MNNAAERQLRRIAVGRANWLFVGSDLRADDAMVLLSLIATCLTRGVEPWAYLTWLFDRIGGWDHRRLDALAPWAYEQAQQQTAQVAVA